MTDPAITAALEARHRQARIIITGIHPYAEDAS